MARDYDLTPKDGISNHWIMMDGLDVVRDAPGAAVVRFRLFRQDGAQETDVGEMAFEVDPKG
jgi:hypothetical protein